MESWIHEIKTPLTACSLILAGDGDPRKLRRELKRADNLTESILWYARMRTAEKDTVIQKIQAASVMEEAVKSQKELLIAAGNSVEITRRLCPSPPTARPCASSSSSFLSTARNTLPAAASP